MKSYYLWPIILVSLLGLFGCQTTQPTSTPATAAEVKLLKEQMTTLFTALEDYAVDNSMSYPDTAEALVPKYLESIPTDPVSRKEINYQKTDKGFLLSATGDYTNLEAEKGFPKMNQDGFYVKTEAEFPKQE